MTDISEINERGLEDILSRPSESTKEILSGLDGDIVVLGAGGKMGPTISMMLKKATSDKKIYAVSRFGDEEVRSRIEDAGIETVQIDLLDESFYSQLPDVKNVFFLAGMKFGSSGNQPLTWAMNSFLPGLVARHYKNSRIVVFSTGNVYPLLEINSGGATEDTEPKPIGEYAQSCLGRERIFEYFSVHNKTPMTIIRLNYANEPRYGIIVDLTRKILNYKPIDLTMGAVNLIWQRDANDYIIQSISLTKSPPTILNVTGPDTLPVRQLAEKIGKALKIKPKFVSKRSRTALLSNASLCVKKFGNPQISYDEMIFLITKWVAGGKTVLDKPTKYNVRDGKF
ncbi:MAG: NAD(P)-dependent oxidoreductase [Sedimentisphaerales bacterium]|nr:NAD(P)-dependent oxidoreductase [Sedimentisphaerales bacterium]